MSSRLVEWIHTKQDWQQKILKDLISGLEPDDNYTESIVTYMKTPEGQNVTSNRIFSQIDTDANAHHGLSRLNYIENVEGVDLLKCDTKLQFKLDNLTVIYGDNGSGKSGYVRILKKICLKPSLQELKSNIHSTDKVKKKCTVSYVQDGKDITTPIDIENVTASPLKDIEIFDTHMGSAYLNEEKTPSYTPRIIQFMQDFASVVTKVAEELRKEKQDMKSHKPTMPDIYASSEHYNWYAKLKSDTSDEEITKYTTWTESNEMDLCELNKGKSKDDLLKDKRDLDTKKTRLKEHIEKINKALDSLTNDGLESLIKLHKAMLDSIKAAEDGRKITDGDILEGVGEVTWKTLWEAARKYSVEKAYVGKPYPYVDEDAKCVLCQQVLDIDAKRRLESFEKHVKGELSRIAIEATKAYNSAITLVPTYDNTENITTIMNAGGITDIMLIEQVKEFWSAVKNIFVTIESADYVTVKELTDKDFPFLQILSEIFKDYESNIKRIDDFIRADTTVIDAKKKSLSAQKWLYERKEQVIAEILLQNKIKASYKLLVDADTTSISRKTSELVEQHITDEYVKKFNNVLSSLCNTDLKVEINKRRIERGRPLFHIFIEDAHGQKHNVTSILSEGEKRILEIASFIADMERKPGNAPFIFDDPISSLDDEYQLLVANRLKKIADNRQVIVFTHRLSLVYDLVGSDGIDNVKYLARISNTSGIVDDVPFVQRRPKDRLNHLLSERIPMIRELEAKGKLSDYYNNLTLMHIDTRKTLECIVENILLNGIVRRYSREIHTLNKVKHLYKIESGDCVFLDDLFDRYSYPAHDQPYESFGQKLALDTIEGDIKSIIAWCTEYKSKIK